MSKIKINNTSFLYSKSIDVIIPAYNARNVIQKTINSTLEEVVLPGWGLNIIVVDDGSLDGTADLCRSIYKNKVQVLSHNTNKGRSAARNKGWKSGAGRYVVFIDADCQWSSQGCIIAHLKALEAGADISAGGIISNGLGFWSTYQNVVQSDRERDFNAGNHAAFTSANFAIRRYVLDKIGGFDEGYKFYGFEDRDLLLRAISCGVKVHFNIEASVIHEEDLSLKEICKKMAEAGQYSAERFQALHPAYYLKSSYSKIDCRLQGFPLTILALFSGPIIPQIARLVDIIIKIPGLPFRIKKAGVKILTGLAYSVGTYRGR